MKITNNTLVQVTNDDIKNGTVIIPNNITTIGNSAFYKCVKLTNVKIPNSVTTIGNCAFYNCVKLTNVIIPNSVTTIGNYAFNKCYSLANVTIPNGITIIGNYAFYKCVKLTNVKIPDSITTIGNFAFYDCFSLTNVKIPKGVTTIGDYAFYKCVKLTNVKIPNSVTTIGNSAFYDCGKLKSKLGVYKACLIEDGKYLCRNYEYRLNEWSEEITGIKCCSKGYHYCTNLFDIFNYYSGKLNKDIAIFKCEVGNKIDKSRDDSKCCTNKIKLLYKMSNQEIIDCLNGK